MFQITPKEQILKKIRKGLVHPSTNKYPLLNFDKAILNKSLIFKDESFIKNWTEEGFFFQSFNSNSDLIHLLYNLLDINTGTIALDEKQYINLFTDNGIKYCSITNPEITVLSSFSNININTRNVSFSTEHQPVTCFNNFNILILVGTISDVNNSETNHFYIEHSYKTDLRIQLNIDYLKSYKKIYLFIKNDL